ncbi:GNAT family N-acetyltransferase [Galactobacter caseinivorans]|uniref:GNAT family N-acetyltransferase n=1 Tax=Galactobacter caseinivorans TaxID=2676123 RepID=UPI001314874D|nr:GNAT family N-acetyltransferase [Galactobacter caseinivorans]
MDQPEDVTLKRAEGGPTWVLQENDALVACLTMSWPAEAALAALTPQARVPGRAWLNQVAVDPAFRGKGAASYLRDVGYAWCREQGATSIGLDTAEPAAHLRTIYSGWGFKEQDSIQWPGKRYRSVVMTRALPEDVPEPRLR